MQRVRTSPGSPAATTALLGTPLHERLAGSSPAERTVCGLMAAPASAAVATMASPPRNFVPLPSENNGLDCGTGTKLRGGLARLACRNVVCHVAPGAIEPYMNPRQ